MRDDFMCIMRIKRITLLQIFFVTVFIALLEPNGILYSPLHGAMGIIRYLGFFASTFIFLQTKIYREKVSMLLISLLIWMGISTILYSGELSDSYIYSFVTMFSAVVLSTYGIKKFPQFYILMMGTILSLWLLLDGLTWREAGTYITANGQRAFFLGTKTTITYYLVPALAFNYVALNITKKYSYLYAKVLNMMAIGGSIVYLIREPISTAIICLVLGVLGYVVVNKFSIIIKFICKYGFLVTSSLNVMFITGNVISVFMSFFTNILHERDGMNGRIEIWNMVLDKIVERPVMGYGYSSQIKFDIWQSYNTSTHNYFLYLFFSMGIIGFSLYIIYILFIHKLNHYYIDENIHRYFMLILTIMNIEAISESYGFNVMTFSFLVTMGYTKKLVEIKQLRRRLMKL